ncbi:R8 protein [Umbelopsis nana]
MSQLEDILGANDHAFQDIWYAANNSWSFVTKKKRMSRRCVLGVNVDQSCKYLNSLSRPVTLQILSRLLAGLARIHHQQCQLHYVDVRNTWLYIKRDLGSSIKINIDAEKTVARMESITLPDCSRTFDLPSSEPVHPFEKLTDNSHFQTDWFFHLRPTEMDSSHIYVSNDYNHSLVESPHFNLSQTSTTAVLPSNRWDIEDLELNIQDTTSMEDAEASIGSQTWQTSSHTPEGELQLSLADFPDNLWNLREEEGALQQFHHPGTFLRPLRQQLPGINEATNESTVLNTTAIHSPADRPIESSRIDCSVNTSISAQHLLEMGVRATSNAIDKADEEAVTLDSNRFHRSKRLRRFIDPKTQLSRREFLDMVSENTIQAAHHQALRKAHIRYIRQAFSRMVFNPICTVYAFELKELWMYNSRKSKNDVGQELPLSAIDDWDQVLPYEDTGHIYLVGSNTETMLVDEPEEARGQQEDAGSDIFIWNRTGYQTDDNMGTLESRGSSVARSIASMGDSGLQTIFASETKPSIPRPLTALDSLEELDTYNSDAEAPDSPVQSSGIPLVKGQERLTQVDKDTTNFFMYTH